MRGQGPTAATYALGAALLGTLGAAGAVALLVSDRMAASALAWIITLGALLGAVVALVAWWRHGPGGNPHTSQVAGRGSDR